MVPQGRAVVVQIQGEQAIIQVFEGTRGLSLKNTRTKFLAHPMEMPLAREILGQCFQPAVAVPLMAWERFILKNLGISTANLSTLYLEVTPETISILEFPRLIA